MGQVHGDDDTWLFLACFDIPVSFGSLFQRVASIDDRCDHSRLNQLLEGNEILLPPGFYAVALVLPRNMTIPSHSVHTILPIPKTTVSTRVKGGIVERIPATPSTTPK
jgi:hypothetical protein